MSVFIEIPKPPAVPENRRFKEITLAPRIIMSLTNNVSEKDTENNMAWQVSIHGNLFDNDLRKVLLDAANALHAASDKLGTIMIADDLLPAEGEVPA